MAKWRFTEYTLGLRSFLQWIRSAEIDVIADAFVLYWAINSLLEKLVDLLVERPH